MADLKNSFLWTLFTLTIVILPLISADDDPNAGPLTAFEKNYTRTLEKLSVNPQCNKTQWCRNATDNIFGMLSHAVAEGPYDELHHLFCTVGAPTLMITRTVKNTKLKVDYDMLLEQNGRAVNFSSKANHTLGMIFTALYEYEDYNDTADLAQYHNNHTGKGPTVVKHGLNEANLIWSVDSTHGDKDYQIITVNATAPPHVMNSTVPSLFKPHGYLSFQVRYDAKEGRLETRPHMEYTSNSSMVSVIMSNLTTLHERSRFVIELMMFSTEVNTVEQDDSTQVYNYTSMDDEYSPGVFKMRNWYANSSKPRDEAWGYSQWKPVVYTNDQRRNGDLSHANSYPNMPYNQKYITDHHLPNRSLFHAYFNGDYTELSINATNVSFGETQDGFYRNTDYLVWTMAVGMGPAPEDDISITVILVIAVGLGIPLVLMIFSVLYVCVKNYKRGKQMSEYTAINE